MQRTGVLIFPPGPGDRDAWAWIVSRRPDLAPALNKRTADSKRVFRGVADEDAVGDDPTLYRLATTTRPESTPAPSSAGTASPVWTSWSLLGVSNVFIFDLVSFA